MSICLNRAHLWGINKKTMKTIFFESKKKPLAQDILPFEVNQAVVGVSFNKEDENLVKYFNYFASKVRVSSAFFVHVMPRIQLFDIYGEGDLPDPIEGGTEISDDVVKKLEQRISGWFPSHLKMYVEYEARAGDPLEELITDTKELKADLLVTGKSTGRDWHGIITKNLIRETVCNTLIIPENAEGNLSHILVPIDFSPNSIRAFQTALAIRKAAKGSIKITCLHVYEVPNINYYQINKTPEQVKGLVEENILKSFKAFDHTYGEKGGEKVNFELVQKEMPGTARFIKQQAGKLGADFIIMGAKGHSRVELLLLGSVTEKVLELNDTIPTLVVK
jgi:nucleotide-binding universal stress UspA family protein